MPNTMQKDTTRTSKTFSTRIDLSAKQREPMIDLLNQHLATLSDLYSQTKYAHWNVRGNNFIALHKLFDELAEEVEDAIDTVAERASALGGVARGTARMAMERSTLEEFPIDTFSAMEVVAALADRYAHAGKDLREAIEQAEDQEDRSTADVFTEVSRMLDQSLYFLESHLSNK